MSARVPRQEPRANRGVDRPLKFPLALSEQEHRTLIRLAAEAGISSSAFLRGLIERAERETLEQIKRVDAYLGRAS